MVRFGRLHLGMVRCGSFWQARHSGVWCGCKRYGEAGVTGYGRVGSGLVCFGRSGGAR
jgi:hypothetical protein